MRPIGHAISLVMGALLASRPTSAHEPAPPRTDVLDPHALPLGDGKVSNEPQRGYLYSCVTRFHGGGAERVGDWIHGSTWDATRKLVVQGDVPWPNARFEIRTAEGRRTVTGNGLPVEHTTGIFPISPSDPAYQIDRNPNGIAEQQVAFALPLSPLPAARAECVPMGMIGVAVSGVAIFNALDAEGRDAVAHEVQDHCNGHPQIEGEYHYHGPTPCLAGARDKNALVGYALDGFGIYSMYDEQGRELTNADLDECHGRTSPVRWDGRDVTMYHYVLTREYPYTIGCYRGTPARVVSRESGGRGGPPPGGGPRRPPAEAVAACEGRSAGDECHFITPRGDSLTGTCRRPGDALACVPLRP